MLVRQAQDVGDLLLALRVEHEVDGPLQAADVLQPEYLVDAELAVAVGEAGFLAGVDPVGLQPFGHGREEGLAGPRFGKGFPRNFRDHFIRRERHPEDVLGERDQVRHAVPGQHVAAAGHAHAAGAVELDAVSVYPHLCRWRSPWERS